MGIRDWLAIIVIVFIVLLILDGFRVKWKERKNRIRVKLDKNIPPPASDDEEVFTKGELPNGGARTKLRNKKTEEVPVLMEAVDLDADEFEEFAGDDFDGIGDEDDSVIDDTPIAGGNDPWSKPTRKGEAPAERRAGEERIEPTFGNDELTFSRDDQGELDLEHNNLFDSREEQGDVADDAQGQAEQVIIINVMAKPEAVLEGNKLLPVLLRHGMRLGEMSIFHRHTSMDGKGPVMFSMANMLKPGTFSMGDMESFATPGVSFFMQLPNRVGNMQCFEQMLKTADAVRNELGAQLKDENRSVFTRQTIEHSRQRIRDFELEMLARK